LERNVVSSWIDRNPMLHLKRTGAYLKYVAKFWDTVFDTPLRDIDQFRMYLADKNRCTLSKREQTYVAWRKLLKTKTSGQDMPDTILVFA